MTIVKPGSRNHTSLPPHIPPSHNPQRGRAFGNLALHGSSRNRMAAGKAVPRDHGADLILIPRGEAGRLGVRRSFS